MEPGEGKKAKKKIKNESKEIKYESGEKLETPKKELIAKESENESPKSRENKEKVEQSYKELEKFIGEEWTGECKWFNVTRGFGFIVPENEESDVFVHQSELKMPGFRSLDKGERVKFKVRVGKNGLEAEDVHAIEGDLKGSSIRPLGKKKENMIRCYKCGNLGYHVASKCKKEFEAPKVCYFCKKSDHLYADCPDRQNKSPRSPQVDA